MLADTANAIKFRVGLERVTHNALLESFGLHARSLLDFLTRTQPDRDTVYAAQYFAPRKWRAPALPSVLKPVAKDANKHFAHLTKTRMAFEPPFEKQWQVGPLAEALLKLLETAFYQPVDKNLLHAEWANGLPKLHGVSPGGQATGTAAQLASAAK